MAGVERVSWIFCRGDARIVIERVGGEGTAVTLVVTTNQDTPRAYSFPDGRALARFQNDMEQFLVATGWSLQSFSPDRRTGLERREFPRITERRRWWTDAIGRVADFREGFAHRDQSVDD